MAADASSSWRTAAFWLRAGMKPVAVSCSLRYDLPAATLEVAEIAHGSTTSVGDAEQAARVFFNPLLCSLKLDADATLLTFHVRRGTKQHDEHAVRLSEPMPRNDIFIARWKVVRDATLDLRRKYNDKLSKTSAQPDSTFRFLRSGMRRFSVCGSASHDFGHVGGFTAMHLGAAEPKANADSAKTRRSSCPDVLAASTHGKRLLIAGPHIRHIPGSAKSSDFAGQVRRASVVSKGGRSAAPRSVRGLLQAAGMLWAEGERRRVLVAQRGGKAASSGDVHNMHNAGGRHGSHEYAPSMSSGRSAATAPAVARGTASPGSSTPRGHAGHWAAAGVFSSGAASPPPSQDGRWPRAGDKHSAGSPAYGSRSYYSSTQSVSGAAWDVGRAGGPGVEVPGIGTSPRDGSPGHLRLPHSQAYAPQAPGPALATGGMLSIASGPVARSPVDQDSTGSAANTRMSGHAFHSSVNNGSPTSMGAPAGPRHMTQQMPDASPTMSGLGYGPRVPAMHMGGAHGSSGYTQQQPYPGYVEASTGAPQRQFRPGPGSMQGMVAMPVAGQGYALTPGGQMVAMHAPVHPGFVQHPAFMLVGPPQGLSPMQQVPMAWQQAPTTAYGQAVFMGFPGMAQQQQQQPPGT